jgi:hypothetical protein
VIDGVEVAVKFEGAHLAIVKDPAYKIQKAQIKGKCSGNEDTCKNHLEKVEAQQDPGKVCKKTKGEECKLSSNKDNDKKYESMTAQDEEKEKEDSNEEELEEKRKEESKKAEEEEKKKEEADEDKDEPMDAEEDDEEKKDSKKALRKALRRIAHLEAERDAEKDVFVKEIVEAKLSKGYIKEAEKDAEIKKLGQFGLVDLKELQAEYKNEKTGTKPAYSVLSYGTASVNKHSDSLLKTLGGGRS